jgi:transcription antitermination factor NusG
MMIAACQQSVFQHKLVAVGGAHTIPLYPDEHTYLEVSHRTQEGGLTGAVGEAQKNFTAKEIEDQTPVKIISSDDNGDQVEITQGPMKGQGGFVAKQNVA